jgi:CRP/FNR family transcriptional regulator, cyclic AMP receptor protein
MILTSQDHAVCRVLDEDPDLAESVPAEAREQALDGCVAVVTQVEPGPWRPPEAVAADAIGFLVLSGLLIRQLEIGDRLSVELLGDGDVLRPWEAASDLADSPRVSWRVLAPARLAMLDGEFTRQLAAYPELLTALFERSARRSGYLATNMGIASHTRVDVRLHMLLWQLAGRWGRVTPEGVVVPIRLTHAVLADLVAARRPTVTSALSELTSRGVIEPLAVGWRLLGDAPWSAGHD